MFTFDPNAEYHMPAFFGPRPGSVATRRYNNVNNIMVCYLTDPKLLAKYIPAPFVVAEVPMITVTYTCAKEVDWLAGRGYNMVGVNAAVKFLGEEDQLEGYLTLVMWENLADPILTGREIKGVPKVYADIPDHQVIKGEWRANASHFSNRILEIKAGNLTALSAAQIAENKKSMAGKDHSMGWKYIPNSNGVGAALSHPVGIGKLSFSHCRNMTLVFKQLPSSIH